MACWNTEESGPFLVGDPNSEDCRDDTLANAESSDTPRVLVALVPVSIDQNMNVA